MHIIASDICSAANRSAVIGSKILNIRSFMECLHQAAEAYDFSAARIPGQGFIQLPDDVLPHVSAGVGKRVGDPNAYCLRTHRGRVGSYLKREFAAPTESCAVVLYTREAYLADPDVTPEETKRVSTPSPDLYPDFSSSGLSEPTHILVAVLATAGPQSQLSPFRFVHNLAGGNKEAQVWGADEIREKAKAILDYDNEWATVADPV